MSDKPKRPKTSSLRVLKTPINKTIKKVKSIVKNTINDFFILIGISTVVYATYRINLTASIYLVGILLILFGLFLAWTRRE